MFSNANTINQQLLSIGSHFRITIYKMRQGKYYLQTLNLTTHLHKKQGADHGHEHRHVPAILTEESCR